MLNPLAAATAGSIENSVAREFRHTLPHTLPIHGKHVPRHSTHRENKTRRNRGCAPEHGQSGNRRQDAHSLYTRCSRTVLGVCDTSHPWAYDCRGGLLDEHLKATAVLTRCSFLLFFDCAAAQSARFFQRSGITAGSSGARLTQPNRYPDASVPARLLLNRCVCSSDAMDQLCLSLALRSVRTSSYALRASSYALRTSSYIVIHIQSMRSDVV